MLFLFACFLLLTGVRVASAQCYTFSSGSAASFTVNITSLPSPTMPSPGIYQYSGSGLAGTASLTVGQTTYTSSGPISLIVTVSSDSSLDFSAFDLVVSFTTTNNTIAGAGVSLGWNGIFFPNGSLPAALPPIPGSFDPFMVVDVNFAETDYTPDSVSGCSVTAPPSISLSTSQANFTYTAGGAVPAPQTISISNSGGGALTWSATPSASWILVVSASNSVSISVNPANLSPGRYTGSVTVTAAGAVNSPQTISVMLLVNAAPVSPGVTAVVNGASFVGGGIVPGEIATIFGTNLTVASGINPTLGLPLVTSFLNGSVMVDGNPAPLFAIDSVNGQEQINFQVPWEVDGESTANLAVTLGDVTSSTIAVPVLAAQPGIFSYSAGGATFAVTLHANYQLADSAHPVTTGETVLIYCTGLGDVNSTPGDGVAATTGQTTVAIPTVTIGGVNAPVSFSGLAPDFVGLNQVNVQIPGGLASGNQPVIISSGGVSSASVLLPVE
jgi:uncharacterized protein (TIGR03437 family)